MPNNLKNTDATKFKAGSKQAEIARKGGIASGIAKRKKAEFRKTLNMMLCTDLPDGKIKDELDKLGMDITYENAVNLAMLKQSIKGDSRAYKCVCEALGLSIKSDDEIKQERELHKLEIEKLKLENERLKAQIAQGEAEIYEGDGFVEALISDGSNTFTEAGDLIED